MTYVPDRYLLVKNLRTHKVHIVCALDWAKPNKHLTTKCGQNGKEFPKQEYIVVLEMSKLDGEVNCKTCRRIMDLAPYPIPKEKSELTAKIYEFGIHNSRDEPVWIKTNRAIGLTTVAKDGGKYLKEVDIKTYDDSSGIDIVIGHNKYLRLLKDTLRLMKKAGSFVENVPIFDRLEKAIAHEEKT
jgi:hypothetical protein